MKSAINYATIAHWGKHATHTKSVQHATRDKTKEKRKVLVKHGSMVCHHANEWSNLSNTEHMGVVLDFIEWKQWRLEATQADKTKHFVKRNIHTSSVESSLIVPASSCNCLSRSSSLACACLTSKEGKVSISAWAIFCWVSASNWASCFCLMIEENDFS